MTTYCGIEICETYSDDLIRQKLFEYFVKRHTELSTRFGLELYNQTTLQNIFSEDRMFTYICADYNPATGMQEFQRDFDCWTQPQIERAITTLELLEWEDIAIRLSNKLKGELNNV